MVKIAASIMCADPLNLKYELDRLAAAPVDMLHCDVMDGLYVANFAMAPYVLAAIRDYSQLPLDIHLAIVEPEKSIKMFAAVRPEFISVHTDAGHQLHRAVAMIKECGVKAAVALSPSTPLSAIKHILPELDMVLAMTVDPGFAGQQFVRSTIAKIGALRQMALEQGLELLIEVDGNIHSGTIPQAVKAGADVLVAGTSALFRGEDADYAMLVSEMRNAATL